MTTTTTITKVELKYEQALQLLNECVEERGADYIYQKEFGVNCVNWMSEGESYYADHCTNVKIWTSPGKPACLIGLVMSRLLGPEVVQERNRGAVSVFNGLVKFTEKSWRLLAYAQSAQDQGKTWGEAVQLGIETAATYSDQEWAI